MVKPGYKQTEVGVIPEDWKVKSVADFGSVVTGGTPKTSVGIYWNGEYPWITPTDISNSRDMWNSERQITNLGLQSIRALPANTVLVTCIASIGKNAILRRQGGCNQQINAIVPSTQYSAEFLYYLFEISKQYLMGNAGTTATSIISKATFQELRFAVPSLPEQQAIATALSDADELIGSLEKLIAKKRQIKQGAMQELLTGKKRLPGFTVEWNTACLEQVVTRATGVWGANERNEDHPQEVKVIRAGDISQDGKLIASAIRFVSIAEFTKAKCQMNDLVITTSGNGLGKVWWCDRSENVIASNFVRVLRPIKSIASGRFLSYVLRSEEGLRQLQEHTATSAYPNLRTTFFSSSWISLPALSEQNAIGEVLSDMDAEIEALESKLAKARQVKQGMMQELLTGRIRLMSLKTPK